MLRNFIILLFIMSQVQINAQTKVLGEYYFNSHEMVAGFNFSDDGKFQFFYSYGAVDRNATGTFTIEGDILKLKSEKTAGHDFTITQQSKHLNGYTLKFEHPNQNLIKDIRCIFFFNGNKLVEYSDSSGEAHVDLNHCDSIYVQHSLYPDILTFVKDAQNSNNRFMLSLNSSLEQISFKGIDFKIVNSNTITCHPNYFLEMQNIEFIKQQ